MREIKFRVWDIDENRFIEWFNADPYIQCSTGAIMCHERTTKSDGSYGPDIQTNQRHFSNKLIIQQYTGIKDVHDKEIYEGDIIRCGKYIPMEVYYDENFGGYYPFFLRLDIEKYKLAEKPEVIGNVFQNKDLVDKKQYFS